LHLPKLCQLLLLCSNLHLHEIVSLGSLLGRSIERFFRIIIQQSSFINRQSIRRRGCQIGFTAEAQRSQSDAAPGWVERRGQGETGRLGLVWCFASHWRLPSAVMRVKLRWNSSGNERWADRLGGSFMERRNRSAVPMKFP
jgi:hypothetical protein